MANVVRSLLILTACILTTSCASRRGVPTDVRRYFGDRAVTILQNPQRVELHRVRTSLPGPRRDFQVVATAPEQDAAFGREFGSMFLSRDAYAFGLAKGCLFQPDTVVRLHGPAGSGSVQFVLCFSCEEFYVSVLDPAGAPVERDTRREDFDGITDRLKALIERAFAPAAATSRASGGV